MIREILDEYGFLILSNIKMIKEYPFLKYGCDSVLRDDNISTKLNEYLKKYLTSTRNELKLYNYIIKNQKKMYEDDIYDVFDEIDMLQYHKDKYTEELFDKIEYAISMEDKTRFFLPRQQHEIYLTNEKLDELKIYLQGFNDENLKRFLIGEGIYNEDKLNEFLKLRNFIDVDIDENINMFGTLVRFNDDKSREIKEIIVPPIKGDRSMIINIHELVHSELLTGKEYVSQIDIFGEDLPMFYENIYKIKNDFVNTKVNETEISKKLVKEYKGEPFMEQIEKYKYYVEKQ